MSHEPLRPADLAPSSFMYEHTDVPEGMTLRDWQAARRAELAMPRGFKARVVAIRTFQAVILGVYVLLGGK